MTPDEHLHALLGELAAFDVDALLHEVATYDLDALVREVNAAPMPSGPVGRITP